MEDPQTSRIVGLIGQFADDILVVINGGFCGVVGVLQDRVL